MVPKEMGILKGEMLTPLKTEILSPTSFFFILYQCYFWQYHGKKWKQNSGRILHWVMTLEHPRVLTLRTAHSKDIINVGKFKFFAS